MKKKKESTPFFWWILFIIIIAVMTGVFLYPLYQNKKARLTELENRKKALAEREKIYSKLSGKVDALENSPEAVEKEAREKFNMARSGEKVLIYDNNKIH
ncbi:MAG: septum formation initiator family protein [Lentisphaeria bacterium]|nr:septum formation initiator family protein [Lentisphaeria bacterium]